MRTLILLIALAMPTMAWGADVKVAFLSGKNQASYQALVELIGQRLTTCSAGVSLTAHPVDGYEELLRQVREESVDMAFLPPLLYVETLRKCRSDGRRLQLLARLERDGEAFFSFSIVTKAAATLADLESKKFVYFSERSSSGYLFPKAWLFADGRFSSEWFEKNSVEEPSEEEHPAILKRVAADPGLFASTYTDAAADFISQSQGGLTIVHRGPPEIPHDAIVFTHGMDPETRRRIHSVIGGIILDTENGGRLECGNITGLVHAVDEDYDVVRKALAQLTGGVWRIGLSLEMDPKPRHRKLAGWRPLRQRLFDRDQIYLELKLYDANETDLMVDHLYGNMIDLAELPPLRAGEAASRLWRRRRPQEAKTPLVPVLIPLFANDRDYEAVIIARKGSPLVAGKATVAVEVRRDGLPSASGYAYLMDELSEHRTTFEIIEYHTTREVVQAVESGEAELGCVARFRLRRMRDAKTDDFYNPAMDVEEAGQFDEVRIPNGAFVSSMRHGDSEHLGRLVDALLRAKEEADWSGIPEVAGLRPSFAEIKERETRRMIRAYDGFFPEDRTSRLAVQISGGIVALLSFVLFFWYFGKSGPSKSSSGASGAAGGPADDLAAEGKLDGREDPPGS